jgi:hypothetical protein
MCGNTPYDGKGIIMTGCAALSHTNFFVTSTTCGGDAFGTELTESRRFSSLGLDLTFERLLLGVSIRILGEGTCSDPR